MGRRHPKRHKIGTGYYSKQLSNEKNSNNTNKNFNTNSKRKEDTIYYDLNVPFPRYRAQLHPLLQRLAETGYSVIALTHTIYGRAQLDRDFADIAIPFPETTSKSDTNKKSIQKRKRGDNNNNATSYGLKILKRLNIVLEDISDISHYTTTAGENYNLSFTNTKNSNSKNLAPLLQSYDLISFTPRTEAILSALSASVSTHMDILTIDYSFQNSGNKLPYALRHSDLQPLAQRGIALELNYGPSMVDPSKRKLWILAAREMKLVHEFISVKTQGKSAFLGRPKIILSSGMRIAGGTTASALSTSNKDLGAMALRSPQDLMNVCQIVLGWDTKTTVEDIMRRNAAFLVERGWKKKAGIRYGWEDSNQLNSKEDTMPTVEVRLSKEQSSDQDDMIPLLGESFVSSKEMTVDDEDKNENLSEKDNTKEEDGFIFLN